MAERDAFGNEIRPAEAGEAFGAAAPAPAAPKRAAPSRTATPGGPPARRPPPPRIAVPSPPPTVPRNTTAAGRGVARSAGGCFAFGVIALVVGGIAISALVGTVGRTVDSARSLSTALSAPSPDSPSPVPRSPRGGSLILRPQFSAAVTKLRGAGLGQPRVLRVAADRIDAQLVTRTGRLSSVQVVRGGALRTLSTTGSGFGATDTIALSTVDRGAPGRLARSAAKRSRRSVASVDYLVLTGGQLSRWVIFLKNGDTYLADRHGRIERKVR